MTTYVENCAIYNQDYTCAYCAQGYQSNGTACVAYTGAPITGCLYYIGDRCAACEDRTDENFGTSCSTPSSPGLDNCSLLAFSG